MTGGLRASAVDGVLSSESPCCHDRSLWSRSSYSLRFPRARSNGRRTERYLGTVRDGTFTWINAWR